MAADGGTPTARAGAARVTWTSRAVQLALAAGQRGSVEVQLAVDRPIESATLRALSRGWLAVEPGSLPSRLEPGRLYNVRLTATMPGTTGQTGAVELRSAGGRAVEGRLIVRLVPAA
jgi:hypothetical protein